MSTKTTVLSIDVPLALVEELDAAGRRRSGERHYLAERAGLTVSEYVRRMVL